ncbi:carcinoembryonic antigen-related cell adhesion molecule 3-like [Apodemus sylvaticus]|uniref:carcinoembryonic antigen-related cell adhesion molecule 3-like n=1 Tax=Apodemus sylvaticus TaxID=10129 RepID=UPI0022425FF6|nr:carcinoembryonic antigen-related cell adhesion molecule 3-like [Apodemus sylvaticus]
MMDSVALYCKDWTSWQGLMLTVSLLACWMLPATAQFTIESVPPIAVEGENVLVLVQNLPEKVQALSWYAGGKPLQRFEIARHVIATNSTVVGPAHSGRETVLPNGSLLIKSVTRKDSGYYTLQMLDTTSRREIMRAEFFVQSPNLGYKKHRTPSQLTIELVPPRVDEKSSMIVLVYNLPEKLQGFVWHRGVLPLDRFKIASHSFLTNSTMLESSYNDRLTVCEDASLLLSNVTHKDTGLYTLRTIPVDLKSECAIFNLQVHKPRRRASDSQRPTRHQRLSKKQREKLDMCFSSSDTVYYN